MQARQNNARESIQPLPQKEELLAKVIQCLPYPIHVYTPDGTSAARAACLSKAHFVKLFKKHTGMTPHQYYVSFRISKLKERLLDTNLSIAQAFAACNVDYNGYSARVFREKTGSSPSAYRKHRANERVDDS